MDLADYLRTPAVLRRGAAELSLPVVHIESLDSATVSWCPSLLSNPLFGRPITPAYSWTL